MAPRPQPYTVEIPSNIPPELAAVLEGVEQNFRALFVDLKEVNDTAESGGLLPDVIEQGDLFYGVDDGSIETLAKSTSTTRYLSNQGANNDPSWAQVDLSNGVTDNLPFANLTPATAASKLLGRGSGAGAGDFEEISIGGDLTMTGTTLSVTVAIDVEAEGYWSPLMDGDVDEPEMITDDNGDAIMAWTDL